MKLTLITPAFAAAVVLTGCGAVSPVIEAVAVDSGREAAKAVVTPIVADTVPGPAGVILTDCIIDNAAPAELVTLASQGGSPASVSLVSDILSRDTTVACATAGLT